MFESQTFETILQRMLDRVDNTYDVREGSVIYDALAPAAAELAQTYIELDNVISESFADTATREYLIRRAAERGLSPLDATYATLQATAVPSTATIPTGTRFSYPNSDINFSVTEDNGDGTFNIVAETAGSEPNTYLGQLLPIDYVEGLTSLTTTEVLIPGEDEEDTEVFRERYMSSFTSQAYGGNKADYIEKTNAIAGVGSTKCTPTWNGGGTVLLTITDSDDYSGASDTLVESVQEEIDPTQDGSGVGIAPIGHIVTVQSAVEVKINVNGTYTFSEGYSFDSLKTQIEESIETYLLTLRKGWADETSLTVIRNMVIAAIVSITGITDVTDLTLNETSANVSLTAYQIPVLGDVTDNG